MHECTWWQGCVRSSNTAVRELVDIVLLGFTAAADYG